MQELHAKERAKLRGFANSLTPIFQIGKGDVTPTLIAAVDAALVKRELIKLSVLETSSLSARAAGELLAKETGAELVLSIGRKFVLYRENPEQKRYEL